MGVTIEIWRAAIGCFRGGRSGITPSTKTGSGAKRRLVGRGSVIVGLLLAALIMSPFLLLGWSNLFRWNSSSDQHQVPNIQLTGVNNVQLAYRMTVFPQISKKKINQLARATTGNRSNRGKRDSPLECRECSFTKQNG